MKIPVICLGTDEVMDSSEAARLIESHGFFILRNFFPQDQVERLKDNMRSGFSNSRWLRGKSFTNRSPDYCTTWITRGFGKLVAARFYQQSHNRPKTLVKIIDNLRLSCISVEDIVNKGEPPDLLRARGKRTFFEIYTIYSTNSGFYPRHKDQENGICELQGQLTLTEYGKDFDGGSLILHLENDLEIKLGPQLQMGDVIIFDKNIEHSVEEISSVKGGLGRWMVLINASLFDAKEKIRHPNIKEKLVDFRAKRKIKKLMRIS
jgi:hypothetical protein